MKKITQKLLLVTLTASALFLASCGDDEDPVVNSPSLQVTGTAGDAALTSGASATNEVETGTSLTFNASISAPGGFNTLFVLNADKTTDVVPPINANTQGIEITANDDGSDDVTYTFQLPGTEIPEGNYQFNFVATDDVGLGQASDTVVFNVTVATSSPNARAYSEILLAAPTENLTNQNFFSVSSGAKYSSSEVTATGAEISPTIDFGYYYGANDLATIASPAGFESSIFSAQVTGWNTKNTTTLKTTTLTSEDFLGVATWADIDDAFDGGTTDDNGIISGLEAGDVLAFETAGGVKGLIFVSAIDLGNDGSGFGSDAFIDVDILAQLDEVTTQ